MSEFRPYLHCAHIEGYKSIVNCDVTFKPGLNIIIGKNGTGKTNLLEAINITLSTDASALVNEPSFSSEVTIEVPPFSGGIKISASEEKSSHQVLMSADDQLTVAKSRFKLQNPHHTEFNIRGWYTFGQKLYDPVFLGFHWSGSIPFLTNVDVGWANFHSVWRIVSRSLNGYSAFGNLLLRIFRKLVDSHVDSRAKAIAIAEDQLVSFARKILPIVSQLTSIEDISLQPGGISEGTINGDFRLSGFLFLFKVGNNHIKFVDLSDGTKRMLLIISEIMEGSSDIGNDQQDLNRRITLLEEPELGIHPHQLHKLMSFIKEQSETKQIILTTHSPQVLDVLGKDELDRIIIADFDSQKGSTFRHLAQAAIEDAQNFMDGMYLSDYWRFSDLEPEVKR